MNCYEYNFFWIYQFLGCTVTLFSEITSRDCPASPFISIATSLGLALWSPSLLPAGTPPINSLTFSERFTEFLTFFEGPSSPCRRHVLVGSGCSRGRRYRLNISTSQGMASFYPFALTWSYRVSRSSLIRCFPKSRCLCKAANNWYTLMHPRGKQMGELPGAMAMSSTCSAYLLWYRCVEQR